LARRFPRPLESAAAENLTLSVAVLDLDHFKEVNDRFGHEAGDAILRTIGDLFRSVTRESDDVVRTGGEEFVLVMPGIGAEAAQNCCERLRRELEAMSWHLDPAFRLTLSAGVASTEEQLPGERLLAVADRRLYAAKSGGRNRVVRLEASLDPAPNPA